MSDKGFENIPACIPEGVHSRKVFMEHLSTHAIENFLHLYTRLQGGRAYTL
jgi:hypothetical protein